MNELDFKPMPPINWFIIINDEKYFEILENHIQNIRPGQYINMNGVIYDKLLSSFRSPAKIHSNEDNCYIMNYVYLKDGNRYHTSIHRLLMLIHNYILGCENLVVNHIDGNKTNNSFENLEWVTSKENSRHAFNTGLHVAASCENHGGASLTNDQVREICEELTKGRYNSQCVELANRYNTSPDVIRGIAIGKTWTNISKDYDIDFSQRIDKTVINECQVREICEELSKERYIGQFTELANKYNVSTDVIRGIAHRKSWNNISKDYSFESFIERKLSKNQIESICQILQEYGTLNNTVFEIISSRLNIELDNNMKTNIRKIFNRAIYYNISNKYTW